MSPTSRWSRNCTPLTTRPSLTSRQGMILRAGTDRLREVDSALPKRLADDRSRRPEPAQILERGDSARRLDREIRKPSRGFLEQLEIGALEHSVPADVGEEEVAGFGEARRDVPGGEAAILRPA